MATAKKNLVIVESPAKAKTISKYLNSNPRLKSYGSFIVTASAGHIRDLPKKELGIDVDNGFIPKYQVTEEKKKLVAELVKKMKDIDMVWLATDNDREGESISFHIKEVLKLKKYNRITFTEITQKALENAILNPGIIDQPQVDAQECRRVLDRLVGFKLSPLLWKRYKGVLGLSAGRVQSAALHIIVNREQEINNFQSTNYWYIMGNFTVNDGSSKQELTELKLFGDDDKVFKSGDKGALEKMLKKMGNKFKVRDTKARQTKQNPDLPFITSTLQQEAYNKFGFTIKRTMQLAQQLYEAGYITYMRTDSYNLSDDFITSAKEYVREEFGDVYVSAAGDGKRIKKSKGAQEAHEAIRPTSVSQRLLENDDGDITNDHKKLYDLIWKRTVAYTMKPAIFDEVDMKISEASLDGMYFIAVFKKCKFNGYLKLYGVESENYNFSNLLKNAKSFDVKCKAVCAKNTWTSPPSRYNESSLIKCLESEGIGRPATFASILAKLYEKQYVIKSDTAGNEMKVVHMTIVPGTLSSYKELNDKIVVGAEKSRMIPTEIGKKILSYLAESFDYIIDKQFTAHMEADLDKIAEKQKTRIEVLKAFWKTFGMDVAKQSSTINKTPKETLKTDSKEIVIEGKVYQVRLARYGPVIQNEKEYINLKPYLKYERKEYMDIDENDVKLLTSFPMKLESINGQQTLLVYGPYGYYIKWGTTNVSMTNKMITNFVKTKNIDVEDIKSSIEYALKSLKNDNTDVKKSIKLKKKV